MVIWRKSAIFVAVTLVGVGVSPIAPQALGQVLNETSTRVTHSCDVAKPAVLGTDHHMVVSPHDVTVKHPERVAPGEVFTIYVHPGIMATGARAAGRLSYELKFPDGATGLSATDTENVVGYSIPGGAPATVERVTADGTAAPEGPFARVSGGSLVRMNPNSVNNLYAGDQSGGITVEANQQFRLPEIAVKLRAPVNSAGTEIKASLKAAGEGQGSRTDRSKNTLTGGQLSGLAAGRSNHFYCSSSQSAASLSVTAVDGSLPTYIAQTATALTTPDTTLPGGSGRTVELRAQVSTDEELMSNVRDGGARVRFDMTNRSTGVTNSVDAEINASGVATTSVTLDQPSGSNTREDYDIRATYTGRAGDIASSSSSTATITSAYNERIASVALSSQNGELAGGSMPVTVKADVSMPSGVQFPAGLQVRLYRNDEPIDVITVPAGGTGNKQVVFPTHSLTQSTATKTYRYRAEVVPLITNNTLDRFTGVSSVPVAAIVTGTNPGSPLPEGGEGSVSLEGFFRAPQLVWDWLTGSIGQAGRFSVGFAN